MENKEHFEFFLKVFKFYFHYGNIDGFKNGDYLHSHYTKRDIEKSISYSLYHKSGVYHLSLLDYRIDAKFRHEHICFDDIIEILRINYPKEYEVYKRKIKIMKLIKSHE